MSTGQPNRLFRDLMAALMLERTLFPRLGPFWRGLMSKSITTQAPFSNSKNLVNSEQLSLKVKGDRLSMKMSPEEIERISHSTPSVVAAVITRLLEIIDLQSAQIVLLENRVTELERQLGRDSKNRA
ncbi:hypothetical protein ACFFNY_31500 [Paenibacillus hodogayensis]|uniref:Uncharacterized protein n=1 Tax=Paenibacillus hodogayensis TaxID=279208 RepID=A0ABV5W7H4_9BACL